MSAILEHVNLRDASGVIDTLHAGADACTRAACRRGSIELVHVRPEDRSTPAATLFATGDLHDNPLHMARLLHAAGVDAAWSARQTGDAGAQPAHLTLHELIHGDRLTNGLDYSYRVLVRAALLKATFPERVHVLLANHELAQLTGAHVAKDGIRYNEAFDEAIDVTFGPRADDVRAAVHDFLRALPLAVRFRVHGLDRDLFCAHSLPSPAHLSAFDFGVFDRPLNDADRAPRSGAAHQMTWGRGHSSADILTAAERLGVRLFILGHEKAESGWHALSPQALILNSDHEKGVYLKVDLCEPALADELAWRCTRLSDAPI